MCVETKRNKIWQNHNHWWISLKGIQQFFVLCFPLFCKFDIINITKLNLKNEWLLITFLRKVFFSPWDTVLKQKAFDSEVKLWTPWDRTDGRVDRWTCSLIYQYNSENKLKFLIILPKDFYLLWITQFIFININASPIICQKLC